MRRMFREVGEVGEVHDYGKKSPFENLQEGSELLKSHGVFTPNPDTKPGSEKWKLAKAELGISEPDEALKCLEYARICKKILDMAKAERDAKIQAAIKERQPEMPKLREVEKDLSNEGVLKAETKPQQQAQASYNEKYQAAMQAAQELAKSGFYTLEDAIRIVMANL